MLRLHANDAWHREGAVRVLGCQNVPDAVEEAVLRWRGEELESTLAAADGVGFVVRSAGQWRVMARSRVGINEDGDLGRGDKWTIGELAKACGRG